MAVRGKLTDRRRMHYRVGAKMSWVELDRIVSEEALRDDDIRRRVEESGRPLRSHAAGMSDDDLLAKLRGLGVDADREKLVKLCDGALSAEEVVSERLGLHDSDADWAWICLTELWQRWWPEKACLEAQACAAMRRIPSMMAANGVTLPGPARPGRPRPTMGCHASEPDEP